MRKKSHIKLLLFLTFSFLFFSTPGAGQNSVFMKKQVPKKKAYSPEKVIDSIYGIEMYKPLNKRLGGDSIRKCDGYACRSWVEDKYKNGQLLHKGYYVDGQLRIYKNYYPDGQMEREFIIMSRLKSKLTKYYQNGQIKSEVVFLGETAKEWTDYYKNGQIKYHEKYDDGINYHLKRESYQKDGTPKEIFKIKDEKDLIFTQKKFHPNGKLKVNGMVQYDKNMFDFKKIGEWEFFDKKGEVEQVKIYNDGELIETKDK